jgi:acylglycerol lipase
MLICQLQPAEGIPTKACLVLLHGFRDHCAPPPGVLHGSQANCETGSSYGIFSSTLASHGIEVHGYDQRGWGRTVQSPKDRGRGGNTEVIMDDLSQLLQTLLPTPVPLFLCGHSMGGGIVMTYAALGPPAILDQLSGFIIWAPLLQLHPESAPSRPLILLLSIASRILPHIGIHQKIGPEVVSRDPEVQKNFVEDELNHPIGTPEGLWGMLERGRRLLAGAVMVHPARKVWVGHGTADRLTDAEGSRKWVEEVFRGEDKVLKLYEGWKHKRRSFPSSQILYPVTNTDTTSPPRTGQRQDRLCQRHCRLDPRPLLHLTHWGTQQTRTKIKTITVLFPSLFFFSSIPPPLYEKLP